MSNTARCEICPHFCLIPEGENGRCVSRKNIGGKIISESYGKITALALDPIEKKPLKMFYPGTMILSIGSYGCNFRCMFCQNNEIAMPRGTVSTKFYSPDEILKFAQEANGNIGIAYTYNEPLINYEFVYDCAVKIREAGLKNVLVTNGFINREPLEKLLPFIDAMNIDLKAFSENFYKKIGGNFQTVKNTITLAQRICHVEVTTLVIPGENENDVEPLAKWLASINPEIPLHLSRFFPQHEYSNRHPTPREMILRLAEISRKYLKNVFVGNV
ncbi:MAG: AmmeMemoRadiSam system radical SAM enzyme [Defluviitaleaceae bacterium]|nr:AmmeMemoRadiSam system radical SAM enzyme [Defluviitaleaceae bacterium]